jgi:hypothetical protein
MSPLETYLQELRAIRATGAAVPETSYYSPLRNLFNEIGHTLKPKVHCLLNPKNRGAGIPDGGLFTADQAQKFDVEAPLIALLPARGAIEVKPTDEDAWVIAEGKQVSRYWGKYGQVLVTNYRDFVLVGQDAAGQPAKLETYRLGNSEAEFWRATANARRTAGRHEEPFTEFVKRVMLHAVALASSQELAWFLASYAREAQFRIQEGDLPTLAAIRGALEEALGLRFEGSKGEHFFRSTLIQTLFYGMFSAWVLWSKDHPPIDRNAHFDWQLSARHLRVPIIRKLFHEVAEPGQLENLKLTEVLDWAGATLDRVDRASFFATFEEGHAVQYFYEPFLEAFDPELRKDLGVWYTPIEVVEYMVARVDTALRDELQIPDGLADPRVYVLDPCCGTGAYLVEVLKRIATTLRGKGGDALMSQDLKDAAMQRVFGFEILPAPFVVSHLQLGLLLQNFGVPLSDKRKERAGVFLTNALTGWEPLKKPKRLPFAELEEERDAADQVKRDAPILVILGNPPYNSFAGIASIDEERDLTQAYRTSKCAPPPQGQGLNDLYVRFFRMAERRIVEKTGRGVVCFISNYSWLDGLSFTGMRERYLEVFDSIWIDCLNGDKYKTGKLTPEGEADPSIFSTEFNREGIQVGTAITLLVRANGDHHPPAEPAFRNIWGKEKRAQLAREAQDGTGNVYEELEPSLELGLPLKPQAVGSQYLTWPLLTELFPTSFPGVQSSRDDLVVDIDHGRLIQRMEQYFDPQISHEDMRRLSRTAMQDTARFKAIDTRSYLLKRGFKPEYVVRYLHRPFDLRWVYWEPETKLLDEKREDYFRQVRKGNPWLVAAQSNRKDFDSPIVSTQLCSRHLIERGANLFPLWLQPPTHTLLHEMNAGAREHNFSSALNLYVEANHASPEALFDHVVATLHSVAYRNENSGALSRDWPRIPLPDSEAALLASAEFGNQLIALLDVEADVLGVTQSSIRPELRVIGVISCAVGKLNPDEGDLDITAAWGHAGKGGVTMPAKGRSVERPYSQDEITALRAGSGDLGLTLDQIMHSLGETTFDVYINSKVYWKNIPTAVWNYTLGGYQVIKKWLSYREKKLLGRGITSQEARHVMETARRIAAILLLLPALDASYENVKRATFDWKR